MGGGMEVRGMKQQFSDRHGPREIKKDESERGREKKGGQRVSEKIQYACFTNE